MDTDTAEQAALAVLDRVLQPHLWIYEEATLSDTDRRDHLMIEALFHLEPTIQVSQRGYDRADAELIGTLETIEQWHQLIVAVTRLLVAAGLRHRSVGSVAAIDDSPGQLPRLPR
jgi:hypothetical protein